MRFELKFSYKKNLPRVLTFESDHGHVKHGDGHEGHPCPDGIYPCPQHCEDFYICYGNGKKYIKKFMINSLNLFRSLGWPNRLSSRQSFQWPTQGMWLPLEPQRRRPLLRPKILLLNSVMKNSSFEIKLENIIIRCQCQSYDSINKN